jgi:polar amino acid transport system permease protein
MLQTTQAAIPFLLHGLLITIGYSALAIVFGTLLGGLLGFLRSLHIGWLDRAIGAYLHLFRGSPFLVQLYVVYFVLPNFGITLESLSAGIVALSLYVSSYITEIVAGAVDSIPRGQREAARSCGMTLYQTYVHVLIPQTTRLVLPPLGSIFVIAVKSTSLFSLIGLGELTREGSYIVLREPSKVVLIYCLVALMYFAFCYPILATVRWAERRYGTQGVKIET